MSPTRTRAGDPGEVLHVWRHGMITRRDLAEYLAACWAHVGTGRQRWALVLPGDLRPGDLVVSELRGVGTVASRPRQYDIYVRADITFPTPDGGRATVDQWMHPQVGWLCRRRAAGAGRAGLDPVDLPTPDSNGEPPPAPMPGEPEAPGGGAW